ncbi:MAG: hypothetical protein ACYDBQ_11530 [Thermoplasmatota archaeon]
MWGRVAWGLGFVAAGLVVAFGLLPGSHGWAPGPKAGIASVLVIVGVVTASLAMAGWIVRRTEAAGGGGCPVGASCGCGHFNFKPRRSCRACGLALTWA